MLQLLFLHSSTLWECVVIVYFDQSLRALDENPAFGHPSIYHLHTSAIHLFSFFRIAVVTAEAVTYASILYLGFCIFTANKVLLGPSFVYLIRVCFSVIIYISKYLYVCTYVWSKIPLTAETINSKQVLLFSDDFYIFFIHSNLSRRFLRTYKPTPVQIHSQNLKIITSSGLRFWEPKERVA